MSHLESLFEGTDLSEDFKEKATAILNTAIEEKVNEAKVEFEKTLKEEYEAKVETKLQELEDASNAYIQEEVMPTIDKYLSAATQEWVNENKLAIESSSKVSLAESFLTGLTGLAAEHKLTLPEGQDQVELLQRKVDELTEQSRNLLDANIELKEENTSFKKSQIVSDVTKSLSESQKEKFQGVINNVEYKNDEQYSSALKSLVESYYPVNADLANGVTIIGEDKQDTNKPSDTISREEAYLSQLSSKMFGQRVV